jgi:3-oxoacid CoA-transferase subunit B
MGGGSTPRRDSNHVPCGIEMIFQGANGSPGIGPAPFAGAQNADLINAGTQTVSEIQGSCYRSWAVSPAKMRGGTVDRRVPGTLDPGARRAGGRQQQRFGWRMGS